jgi:hypothetical protein
MKIEFWFPNETFGNAAVEKFEQLIGNHLPESFRRFLSEQNGGNKPKKENFSVLSTGERTMLSVLYKIDCEGRGELYDEYIAFKSELPDGIISIGGDIGGNKICLNLSGAAAGEVLFYDHEIRPTFGKIPEQKLGFCAGSFAEFIEQLE